jgi:hypothetical protein
VPFIIKLRYGEPLEVYPSIILPSGAYLVKIKNDTLNIYYSKIYVKNSQSQWVVVNVEDILKPIPVQYFYTLSANNFGFSPQGPKVNLAGYPGIFLASLDKAGILKEKEVTPEESAIAITWVANNIEKNTSIQVSAIKIAKEKASIYVPTGKVVKKEFFDESIINLD